MTITYGRGISPTRGISLPRGISPYNGLSISGFSPSQLTGLAIWLDAADTSTLTFNTTTISAWANKGNQGVGNATQGTALNQPLYVANGINGRPGLEGRHDGVNGSLMSIADVNPGLNYTEFNAFAVVVQITNLVATAQMFGKYTTTGNQREHRMTLDSASKLGSATSLNGTATTSTFLSSPATVVGTPFICDLRYTTTGPLQASVLNNAFTASAANPASAFNGTAPYNFFAREVAATESFAGRIGEYIFFNRALTAFERLYVLRYLSAKWGVTIS